MDAIQSASMSVKKTPGKFFVRKIFLSSMVGHVAAAAVVVVVIVVEEDEDEDDEDVDVSSDVDDGIMAS
jgi:hypothetical protein